MHSVKKKMTSNDEIQSISKELIQNWKRIYQESSETKSTLSDDQDEISQHIRGYSEIRKSVCRVCYCVMYSYACSDCNCHL